MAAEMPLGFFRAGMFQRQQGRVFARLFHMPVEGFGFHGVRFAGFITRV